MLGVPGIAEYQCAPGEWTGTEARPYQDLLVDWRAAVPDAGYCSAAGAGGAASALSLARDWAYLA